MDTLNILKIINDTIKKYYNRPIFEAPFMSYSNVMAINEKYGLLYYDSYTELKIQNVSYDIEKFLKSSNYKYNVIIDKLPGYRFKRFYCQLDLPWIKKLNIFVTHDLYDGYVDTVVLDDTYNVKYENKINNCYIKNKNTIEYVSIVVFGKDQYYSIKSRILHELKHIFDSSINDLNNINSDIDGYNKIQFDDADIKLILKLYSCRNITLLKDFVKKLSTSDLFTIFAYNIYLLNESEMQARLEQIKEDIEKIEDTTLSKKLDLHGCLLQSSIYREYMVLYNFFLLCKKYIPDHIKREYELSSEHNYIINTVYIKRKVPKQFDKYVMYFAEQIYNKVLRHSANLIINKNEKTN